MISTLFSPSCTRSLEDESTVTWQYASKPIYKFYQLRKRGSERGLRWRPWLKRERSCSGCGRGPFSRRVNWLSSSRGVEHEYVNEDLPCNKSKELLRYNPVTEKMHVLVHRSKAMAESQVIIEYVDETRKDGYPIMPKDASCAGKSQVLGRVLRRQGK
ncbi:hypothetical protein MUK42_35503 [Musa troglodytarum]|uniref:GST N-terminal domain-containing protein n=1 Tax=Musa troglodytarum TaxID=320322 RepID=A0A9E7GS02_9LILI|nr:hypothetical protein MUK42_35503 [Musa troglodytarum]